MPAAGTQHGRSSSGRQRRRARQRAAPKVKVRLRLLELMQVLNVEPADLARQTGINRNSLYKYRRGDSGVSEPVARRIAEAMGLANAPHYLWEMPDDGGLAEACRHVDMDVIRRLYATSPAGAEPGPAPETTDAAAAAAAPAAPQKDRWEEVLAELPLEDQAILRTLGRDTTTNLVDKLATLSRELARVDPNATYARVQDLAHTWIAAAAPDVPAGFRRLREAFAAFERRVADRKQQVAPR
jgi:transcriptional regulator with XRE-family HTH domain